MRIVTSLVTAFAVVGLFLFFEAQAADTKISDLTATTSWVTGDLTVVVDVSDTTMAASGTNKKLTIGNLFATIPVDSTWSQGSAADPTVTIQVESGGTGDPLLSWYIQGATQYWTAGIDNSASDVFVIAPTADLTSAAISITPAGATTITTPSGIDHDALDDIEQAYKTADESINTDTTLTDDSDITVSVDVNGIYSLKFVALFDADAAGDIKFRLNCPSGTAEAAESGEAATVEWCSADLTASGTGVGTNIMKTIEGVVLVGGTGGTLTLQWAQNASDANNTTLQKGSFIRLLKLN